MFDKKYLGPSVKHIRKHKTLRKVWDDAKGDGDKFANALLTWWTKRFWEDAHVRLDHGQHGWILKIWPLICYTKTGIGGGGSTWQEGVVFWTGIYLSESTLDPIKNGKVRTR